MKQAALLTAVAAALFLAMPAMTAAEMMVTADFSDALGVSTDYVDAYRGKPGLGWANAWFESKATNVTMSNQVVDTSPLHDGGNYLSYSTTHNNTTGASTGAICRNYLGLDPTEPRIDVTKDYTIRFSLRIDEEIDGVGGTTAFTTSDDRYLIHGRTITSTSQQSDYTATFDIRLQASRPNDDLDGYWFAYDGAGNYYQMGNNKVADGVVYDFTIDINADRTWDVTISGNGETSTATGIAWRGPSHPELPSGSITFAAVGDKKVTGVAADVRAWSIDAIKVSQIPEPTALAMVLAMLLLGMTRRHK